MQNVNKGLFDQVLRELCISTHCIRWTIANFALRDHPAIVEATWNGYLLRTSEKGVEVHAMDNDASICCACADRLWETDDQEEGPPPQFPSLAGAVAYRPPTASRYNRLDDFRQYAVYHNDDESDSDHDDGFRQAPASSSSSSYDQDEW